MEDIRLVRERFAKDRFATQALGARIDEIGEGYAVCSLTLGETHRNAAGGIMGGVAFTLADFAFAVASNALGGTTVSLDSHIAYTAAPKGDRLIARAQKVKDGRSTCYYTVEVSDDRGTAVAFVSMTGFHPRAD